MSQHRPKRARSDGASGGSRRLGRTALVLFFCAGIAGFGLLTGGEHPQATAVHKRDPMKGYYPAAMPRYPDVDEQPMGSTEMGGSGETLMSHFVTRDEPDRVADFYLRAWRRHGLWARDDITHRGGVVSAVDAPNGRIYQVLIDARSKDATHVFPSSNAMPSQIGRSDGADLAVSLYPGSEVLMDLKSTAGPHQARTVMSTSEATVAENVAHYRSALAASGYREDLSNQHVAQRVGGDASQRVLVYRSKQGAEITVNISKLDKARTRVHIMTVGD